MKKETTDRQDDNDSRTQNTSNEKDQAQEPTKKESLEERAKRENWTDVAESHLGIDE